MGRIISPIALPLHSPIVCPMGIAAINWLTGQIAAGSLSWAWRATNVIVSGTAISQITDLTGGGRHLTQASGLSKPSIVASWRGGQPAVGFSGTRWAAVADPILPLTDWTFGCVLECTDISVDRSPMSFGTATTGAAYVIRPASGHGIRLESVGIVNDSSTGLSAANSIVFTRTGAPPVLRFYLNGVEEALDVPSATMFVAVTGARIGSLANGTQPFVGRQAEGFVAPSPFSAMQIAAYHASVKARYILPI